MRSGAKKMHEAQRIAKVGSWELNLLTGELSWSDEIFRQFEIDKSRLTVTASDLQTSMITEINVESKERGNMAVPARILLDTLKNLPDQPVTFSMDESTYSIELSSDNGRYKLSGENATDFPKVPAVSTDFSASICYLLSIVFHQTSNQQHPG